MQEITDILSSIRQLAEEGLCEVDDSTAVSESDRTYFTDLLDEILSSAEDGLRAARLS